MQPVFSLKCGPGRGERDELHLRTKALHEGLGVGFRQQRYPAVLAGRTQKRHGQREIAETPQLQDQQSWLARRETLHGGFILFL
jgi:hypothetical protein